MAVNKALIVKSAAHIKSHPVHPILIAFPIAFLTGTLLFDVIFLFTGNEQLAIVSRYMQIAGIATGLIAAIPGAIDYFRTVPPGSSAKKRATKHALLNIVNIVLFSWALYLKSLDKQYLPLFIELSGVVMMSIAGWLGGTLVYRNQIGVDIRYANAGKWKEENAEEGDRIFAATNEELQKDQMKLIRAGNRRIVLCRSDMGYTAIDDFCTHRGGSLAGGALICGTVQCPWHGSQFDVTTGEVKAGPAKDAISVYRVEATGEGIYILLR